MSNNIHFTKGKELYQSKNYNDAINAFSEAIKSEENPYIYYERAMAFFHNNQIDLAIADLNTAAQLQPNNPFRFSSRAYIKDLSGDVKGAIEDYEQCIKLDPNDAIAHNNLSILQDKLGRKISAAKNAKQADKLAAAEDYLKAQQNQKREEKLNYPEKKQQTIATIIKDIFTSKKAFNEFITFVKNGFKYKTPQ